MLEWISNNKEWLFSGLGVFVFGIIYAYYTNRNKKGNNSDNKYKITSEQQIKLSKSRANKVNKMINKLLTETNKKNFRGLHNDIIEFRNEFNKIIREKNIALKEEEIVLYHEKNIELNELIRKYEKKITKNEELFHKASRCHRPSTELAKYNLSVYNRLLNTIKQQCFFQDKTE